jgi:tetratricopeptide (TPR) repeat protein
MLFCLATPCARAQNDPELKRLDSMAFQALENNDPSVSRKAKALLEASQRKGESLYSVNAHTILGIVNKEKGYYLTSINHYLKALNSAEKLNDLGRVSACYNNIGGVYLLQENYVVACDYFNKSLAIEEKLKKPLQKSIRYYNLGDAYSKMDSFDLALSYFTNSLLIEERLKNPEGIIYAELGIAEVYLKLNRVEDCQGLLTKISKSIGTRQIEENILHELLQGKVFLQQNKLDLALQSFNLAESQSLANNFRIHLLDIYLNQIEVHKQSANWQRAVKTYERYVALKEELNTTKIKNQLEDLTFRNELTKKELEIKLIQEEKQLAEKNEKMEKNASKQSRKIVWFLIISLFLLFGLIFVGIRKISSSNET